jgi:low temperature requirement protein LtrA
MLASLLMSAWLPDAFGDRGLEFAAAYVALNVGRTVFAISALDARHPLSGVFRRPLVWWSLTGLLWLGGGLAHGDARIAIWLAAVIVEYGGVWLGFPVPRLGRSRTTDYTIAGGHMAERCHLFVILALGESILRIGVNFSDLASSPPETAAFVVAFLASVSLWWIYFDRSAEAARHVISAARDPGRLGAVAYTYFHLPMVAGIIASAAADQLTIAHPDIPLTTATAALILGGPALYLAGNALFKHALWGELPRSRMVALGALGAMIALALVSSPLVLLAAATAVLAGVALWDTRSNRMAAVRS